jgi:esterase/lipase/1-acyl-sn-glycerol-3-phosphate acyltransferase
MLDRVFRSNLHVDGLDHLSSHPTLFVVNHFTRSETLLLPYVIYKHHHTMVHSLADSGLFQGRMGNTLRDVGAISTREPFRNRRIIKELITGEHNWVIFPEGLMVKNKRIYHKGQLMLDNPERKGPPHTGAAVLALKSELIKRSYVRACKCGDHQRMRFYEDRYNFRGVEQLNLKDTVITPVNISYYPVRPHQNYFISLARLMSGDLSSRAEEELAIESNILLSKTDINIYFSKPIYLGEVVETIQPLLQTVLPFVDEVKRMDWIVSMYKNKLTRRFMNEIYTKVSVNMDNIFAACLRAISRPVISERELQCMIYLIAYKLSCLEERRLHPTLGKPLLEMISDHPYAPFEASCELAEKEGCIKRKDGMIEIQKEQMNQPLAFHSVRMRDLMTVFANEIEPLKGLQAWIGKITHLPQDELMRKVSDLVQDQDLEIYKEEYHHYRSEMSKGIDMGQPYLLTAKKCSLGVVLCHGYLASPAEVLLLAQYLNRHGVSVYAVRLAGHGTSPEHMKDIRVKDWIVSFDRAYAVMRHRCRHLILGGFSAGGVMALLAAANKPDHVQGVFTINAALKLQDIRSKMAATVTAWNDLLDRFKVSFGKLESVENHSQNPEVNYELNYLNGVKHLESLIKTCRSRLDHVIAPALIIQGDEDPVVKAESADLIANSIRSDALELHMVKCNRHHMLREDDEEIFEKVLDFVNRIRSSFGANQALMS